MDRKEKIAYIEKHIWEYNVHADVQEYVRKSNVIDWIEQNAQEKCRKYDWDWACDCYHEFATDKYKVKCEWMSKWILNDQPDKLIDYIISLIDKYNNNAKEV